MFDLTKAKVAVVADSKVATVIEEKQAADDAGSNGLGLGEPELTNINAAEVRDTVAATGASGAVATLANTTQPLTNTQVERSKPRDTEYKLGDGNGLFLAIKPSGKKTWIFNCHFFNIFSTKNIFINNCTSNTHT